VLLATGDGGAGWREIRVFPSPWFRLALRPACRPARYRAGV